MTTTIRIRSPKDLGPALRKLGRSMDAAMIVALRKTARWGAGQALMVSATTQPRPRASGTYERSFVVTKIPKGALLSNSAGHAIFVELGRRPGRMPPVAKILEWMILKRIDKQISRQQGRDAGGRFVAATQEQLHAVALRIARAIGKRGIKGRKIMQQLQPLLRARLRIEIDEAMKKAFASAPDR